MYEPKEHEQLFGVRPIGVKYICEFCNEGEMKYQAPEYVNAVFEEPHLYPHACTKCGKTMRLPKMYPYIEWMEVTQQEILNETMDMVKILHNEFNKIQERESNNETD